VRAELEWGEFVGRLGQQIASGGEICIKIYFLSKKKYFLSSIKY
jgi:hypothetical protein